MAKTVNEKFAIEAVRHRLFLSRYSNAEAARMQALLRKGDIELAGRIMRALDDTQATAQNVSVGRLERIRQSIKGTISTLYKSVFGDMKSKLEQLASGESEYQASAMRQIIPSAVLDHFPITDLPAGQVWAAANAKPFQGATLSQYQGLLGDDLTNKINNAVKMGIIQGEPYDVIIRRITGTPGANYTDAVTATSARDLATVTRTAVSHVAAEARDQIGEANADIIQDEQWLSTLDTHTSKICIVRDHLHYDRKTKAPIGHHVPYGAGPGKIHFNCRSTSVFGIKSLEELGIAGFKMPAGVRASMNGPVPADLNYTSWMKSLPQAELERVVGTDRAQLIRDGKLEPAKMFKDDGEFLTLEQLRALDRIPSYD